MGETSFFRELREDLVRFLQRFLRADVEPKPRHTPGINRRAWIKPLHQPARLVGIVALSDVLLDERYRALRIKIKRDAGECAGRILRFFLEEDDAAGGVGGDGIVFFDFLKIAPVVKRQHRRFFLAEEFSEMAEFFAEQMS